MQIGMTLDQLPDRKYTDVEEDVDFGADTFTFNQIPPYSEDGYDPPDPYANDGPGDGFYGMENLDGADPYAQPEDPYCTSPP